MSSESSDRSFNEVLSILSSKSRLRIIFHLLENRYETKTRLLNLSRVNSKHFHKQIKALINLGILEQITLGKRIVIFKLNTESKYYTLLKEIYRTLKGYRLEAEGAAKESFKRQLFNR